MPYEPDLYGHAYVDGYGGFEHHVAKLAKVPDGYFPVGVSLFTSEPYNYPSEIELRVLCVDSQDAGTSEAEVREYVKSVEVVSVRRFRARVPFREVLRLVQRFNATLTVPCLKAKKVAYVGDDD